MLHSACNDILIRSALSVLLSKGRTNESISLDYFFSAQRSQTGELCLGFVLSSSPTTSSSGFDAETGINVGYDSNHG